MLKDRFCGFRWNDLSKQLRQSNCDKDIRTAIHTKLSFNLLICEHFCKIKD